MKRISVYERLNLDTSDQVFEYLVKTFGDTIKAWDYFVNWEKVFRNTKELEVYLGIWNYLLGKKNFDEEFRFLLKKYPESIQVLPSLVVRDGPGSKTYKVLVEALGKKEILLFDFSQPAKSERAIEDALFFIKESGLISIFGADGVKNLVDYLIGVEAGVDSNGRKNRSGKAMEAIVEDSIARLTLENPGWKYLAGASQKKIKTEWGITNSTGVASRTFDFAILANQQLFAIEVNVFGSNGTKAKSVAGEFTNLEKKLKSQGVPLIWITDGMGWLSAEKPLRDAFDSMDYVLNLNLLREGALEATIFEELGKKLI